MTRYPCVHISVSADNAELASMLLWEAGATGIEERDAETLDRGEGSDVTLVAHFDSDEDAASALDALGERFSGAKLAHIEGDEWKERWKEFFKPTRVGRRIVVRPSWEAWEAREGDVVLTLDPGQAFGTGTHESTRLVLEELDSIVQGGERVLDVGCGSGILSIAALLLGANEAIAIDVDPIAVRVTEENATVNAVGDRLDARACSVDEVIGGFDLVLANIQSSILVPMAPLLVARASRTLILSGLLATEEDEVRDAYRELCHVRTRTAGEWIALTFVRNGK